MCSLMICILRSDVVLIIVFYYLERFLWLKLRKVDFFLGFFTEVFGNGVLGGCLSIFREFVEDLFI